MNLHTGIKTIDRLLTGNLLRNDLPGIAAVNVTTQANRDLARPKPMDHENGHEIILRTLIRHRTPTKFRLLSGDVVTGTISQFDKSTITVRQTDGGKPVTLFKHAIEAFQGLETLQ